MTSRETTGFLPRTHSAHERLRAERTLKDKATILAFGVLNAPFLLKSLHGGSRKDKRALLAKLGLPADALPNLGSWKADMGLLKLVTDHILTAKPHTVVEFGTGASTLIMAKALQMTGAPHHLITVDQYEDFSAKTRDWLAEHGLSAEFRAAPLVDPPLGWPGLWYDPGTLPDKIDFILIDGPNWAIHPFTRGAAESLFDRLPIGGVVMLDDAARPGERVVARRWRRNWPNMNFSLSNVGTKGTLIGRRIR